MYSYNAKVQINLNITKLVDKNFANHGVSKFALDIEYQ